MKYGVKIEGGWITGDKPLGIARAYKNSPYTLKDHPLIFVHPLKYDDDKKEYVIDYEHETYTFIRMLL